MTATQAAELAFQYYGIIAQVHPLPGEIDLNFHLKAPDGREYIFKLAHPGTELDLLNFQNALMQHLATKAPGLQAPAVIPNQKGERITTIQDDQNQNRYLRLLTWLPGRLWAHTNPHTPALLTSLGRTAGTLTNALLDFDHPGGHRYLKWDASEVPWVGDYLELFDDEDRNLLEYFLDLFQK